MDVSRRGRAGAVAASAVLLNARDCRCSWMLRAGDLLGGCGLDSAPAIGVHITTSLWNFL